MHVFLWGLIYIFFNITETSCYIVHMICCSQPLLLEPKYRFASLTRMIYAILHMCSRLASNTHFLAWSYGCPNIVQIHAYPFFLFFRMYIPPTVFTLPEFCMLIYLSVISRLIHWLLMHDMFTLSPYHRICIHIFKCTYIS